MPSSRIDIVNIALSNVGAEKLYSFDEKNTRARLLSILYDQAWMMCQSDGNWRFLDKIVELSQLSVETPQNVYAFALPSDCIKPVDLYPSGQNLYWERVGDTIYTELSDDVWLRYSMYQSNSLKYPPYFVNALSAYLTMLICRPIAGEKVAVREEYRKQYEMVRDMGLAIDANASSGKRAYGLTPPKDSFSE